MDILLNFVPLKSGGGLQVGLDFVRQAKLHGGAHRWHLVATAGTALARIEPERTVVRARMVERTARARAWFEYVGCRALTRRVGPAAIYTQFGPQWPGARGCVNVVGCAYSNLFYPEIDFWRGLVRPRRFQRQLIDRVREARLRDADAVVFETQDLAERAVSVLALDAARVHVVRPSISSLVSADAHHEETHARCQAMPAGFRVLLLSAYNPNKNIELLPDIARALRDNHARSEVVFVITLPFASRAARAVLAKAEALGVRAMVHNLGPIDPAGCAEVYRDCDAVILPSQLESFSNTIAEAWAMDRPLLISDMPWSRALCGEGAAYFAFGDAGSAAATLRDVETSAALRMELVRRGRAMLGSYPTAEQRFRAYVHIIERYAER